jgi:hypothetical protein
MSSCRDINTCKARIICMTLSSDGDVDDYHDLQPVSVVLKLRPKTHILYSTLVRSEFGVEYEIVISRSRLLRALGEQAR